MQTLEAGQYGALDDVSRNPCARVYLDRGYDSIPFLGRVINENTVNEKFPCHLIHSTGRICLVYSKYNTGSGKYNLYYKYTNTSATLWETEVALITTSTDCLNPTIVELANGNLGIVVNYGGTLYSGVINTSGTILTAFATLSTTGVTPSLTKVSTTYWLVYEASGTIYSKTSANFSTWGAATNLNTLTGLANNHYFPKIYYSSANSKLWLTFERLSATSPQNVYNVYYMNSTNAGVNWNTPVAMTTTTDGSEGNYRPSLVDVGDTRYFSYTKIKQISQYQSTATLGSNGTKYFVYDEDNDRVLYISEQRYICIYDRNTGLETIHDIRDHASYAIASCYNLCYDSVNNIIAVRTYSARPGGGYYPAIVIYNEDTTTWTEVTMPYTSDYPNMTLINIAIKNKKVYYACQWASGSYQNYHGFYDINLATFTTFSGDTCYGGSNYIIPTDNMIIYYYNTENPGMSGKEGMRAYSTVTNTLLFQTILGSYISFDDPGNIYMSQLAFPGYDYINNELYAVFNNNLGTNNANRIEGIKKYSVTSSGATLLATYTNEIDNQWNLLPNPDFDGAKYLTIVSLNYKNDRLYIMCELTSGATSYTTITTFDTILETAINHITQLGVTWYATYFPEIDNDLIKILTSNYLYNWLGIGFGSVNDDQELIFGGISNDRWAILITEGEAQSIYYRSTTDDSSWATAVYLTNNLIKDDYSNLGVLNSSLICFWQRTIDGISCLRWDQDFPQFNLSQYVKSIEITKSYDEASKATLVFVDKEGLFEPLNYSSLYYDYLKENNLINIQKGNNSNYTDAFTGRISSGTSTRLRGGECTYTIDVIDKSKNFLKKKVTTSLYENQTITAIAENVAANYMSLDVSEYSFPIIGDIIATVQFIDEYPMDILKKIFQGFNYFPYFDESGVLRAKETNYDASTDFTYYKDGTDTVATNKAPAMNVINFNYQWTDKDLYNKVRVIGETAETSETTFDEEYLGFIQGAAGWFSKTQEFTFYFSDDKKLYCDNIRLGVEDSCGNKFFGGGEWLEEAGTGKQLYCTIYQRTSNLITALYILIAAALLCVVIFGKYANFNPLAYVVSAAITILGQIGSYYYEIYGCPVGEAIPTTIIAEADDDELIEQYGEIVLEIDNPFLDTYAKCSTLAQNELQKAKWFRYIPTLKILSNMAHQIGDVISVYNPGTERVYKIFITEINQSYRRGEEDIDTISGGLII